jgi:signal transduction histidine kinase
VERTERDRTALLAHEQASRREADDANRAKDVFLATLSHEMRTPLNAIVGWLSILRHAPANEETLTEGLNVIERNTAAQVQLIDDVLDVSRIVSGKLRVEIHPCELIDVVNAGLSVARPAAEAKEISVHVDFDPTASSAACDAGRIQQVSIAVPVDSGPPRYSCRLKLLHYNEEVGHHRRQDGEENDLCLSTRRPHF